MNQANQAQELTKSPSEFTAVTGGGNETSASGMLVAAYAVFWLLLLAFIALSWKRQRELSTRLLRLEKALGDGEPSVRNDG